MIGQPQLFLIIFELLSRDFSASLSSPLPSTALSVSVCCSLCIYFKINCSFVAKLLEWGFHFHLQQKTVASGIAIAIGIEQTNPPSAYAFATAYVSCLPGSGQTNSCDRLLQQDLARERGKRGGEVGTGHARSNQSARLVFAFLFCLFEHCCCRRCCCSLLLLVAAAVAIASREYMPQTPIVTFSLCL